MKRRDWTAAREKCDLEGQCRVCTNGLVEAAHVIGREHDVQVGEGRFVVLPEAIIPLCRDHHRAYDARELDLLPYLKLEEQVRAVLDAGGIVAAYRRTTGERLEAAA